MATTFYGHTLGAQVVYVGKNCRRGGGKPVIQIGAVEWKSADEQLLTGALVAFRPNRQVTGGPAVKLAAALFAARVEHRDNRADYDVILTRES